MEVFSDFCGFCLATGNAIRKGKLEIGQERIAMVKVIFLLKVLSCLVFCICVGDFRFLIIIQERRKGREGRKGFAQQRNKSG